MGEKKKKQDLKAKQQGTHAEADDEFEFDNLLQEIGIPTEKRIKNQILRAYPRNWCEFPLKNYSKIKICERFPVIGVNSH